MAFLAPNIELFKLWEERSDNPEFKMRDEAYKVHRNAYQSRTADGEKQNITWRPIMLDGQVGDTRGREPINMTKQIGLHHTAAAAEPPRLWNEPGEDENQETAEKNTALIQRVFDDSRIKLLQVKQAHSLAVSGDAPYGVVFDQAKKDRCLWLRVMDPSFCYPALDDTDPANLKDMLITYEVRRGWAEKNYGVSLPINKSHVRVFEYFDDEYMLVQVEKVRVHSWTIHHQLDFTPWYWCFNQVPGMYAQADVAETPKLQGTMNELMILALDAMRRNIDKSYYSIGHKGTVVPQPGKVVGFPNPNTKIDEFPTAVPPAMITELMQYVQANAQSMAGISPISMEGVAGGSIVTGSAVRHQVEAIEARAKAKRGNLEAAFSWVGEAILKIYADKFPDHEMRLRLNERSIKHTGSQIGDWTRCRASYGGADGLPQSERQNWALQGLGRLHGRRTAIALTYPERDTEAVEREIDADQLHQAELAAKAQLAAQQVVQSGEQAGPSAGESSGGPPQSAGPAATPPQVPGRAPQPGAAMFGGRATTIGDLQLLISLVRNDLKGDVYAVGEMAVTGMSQTPVVAVTREEDQARVQSVVQARRGTVVVGLSEDQPRVQLNA